jgi:transposase InsO family protein
LKGGGQNSPFRWTEECDVSFALVQKLVSNTKLLHHPDFTRPFYIQTDASNGCIGAILFQYDEEGNVLPIEFMSRKLSGAQLNWHSNEKECFAVLSAIRKWYDHLRAEPFTIFTDHKNFETLLSSADKISNSRTHRWAIFLRSECKFTVRHIAGSDNIPADYLSRDIIHDTPIGEARRAQYIFMMQAESDYLSRAQRAKRTSKELAVIDAATKEIQKQQRLERYLRRTRAAAELDVESEASATPPALENRRRAAIINDYQPDYDIINGNADTNPFEQAERAEHSNQPSDKDEESDDSAAGTDSVISDDDDIDIDVRRVVIDDTNTYERSFDDTEDDDSAYVKYDDEPWEGESSRLSSLRFEDPEFDTLIDHTTWDEYLNPAMIRLYQRADPFIGKIYNVINNQHFDVQQQLPYSWLNKIRNGTIFCSEQGMVLYNLRIMIPPKLRMRILNYFHTTDYFAHQGAARMKSHVSSRFYWVSMAKDITDYCSKCRGCTSVKGSHFVKKSKMKLFPSRYPFHMVAIDLVEFPHSRRGFKHLLTMIDRFSRFVAVVPLKNSRSATVIAAILKHWIYRFGVPEFILSDNGPQFTAKVFKQFRNLYHFKHRTSARYHPQTNGMIERFHRYLKQRAVLAGIDKNLDFLSGDEWEDLLAPIVFAYNATVTRMTGYSPHELVHSRSPKFPVDLVLNLKLNEVECKGSIHEYTKSLAAHQRMIFLNANRTQDDYDKRRKASYDRTRDISTFIVGDIVTRYNWDNKVGKKRKFSPKWVGIWRIEQMYDSNAVFIREMVTGATSKENVSKLKRISWYIDQTL